ncbi:MAG: CoA ester lyase [Halieaceae bacterium]|nr:CoA ester lyase [Halieaceae bacterium]
MKTNLILRSFLFAPGNHARKVEKAFTLDADAVILDLEDSVPAKEKILSRKQVIDALSKPHKAHGYIRINGCDTEFFENDIQEVVGPWLDGIVLPKAETSKMVEQVSFQISEAEKKYGLPLNSIELLPIIETAKGIENANEIAAGSDRIYRLAFGGGDYTLDLNYIWNRDEEVLSYARSKIGHACRVANIEPPIDTVVLEIKDDDRFIASAERGRTFGFSGKLCIHPDQISLCNKIFSPDGDEIAYAQKVILAFAKSESDGSASIEIDGNFVDYAIVKKAQRIIDLQEILERRSREK